MKITVDAKKFGGADTAFILPMRAANGWNRLETAA